VIDVTFQISFTTMHQNLFEIMLEDLCEQLSPYVYDHLQYNSILIQEKKKIAHFYLFINIVNN
jgi:hypothetical protein